MNLYIALLFDRFKVKYSRIIRTMCILSNKLIKFNEIDILFNEQ